MKGNHENKIKTKANFGIRGMNCPCCRFGGPKSEAKSQHSRNVRRQVRTTLKNRGKHYHDE